MYGILILSLGQLVSHDPLLQVMPHLSLAVLLLNERFDPQSFWKPYIGIVKDYFYFLNIVMDNLLN